MKEKYFIAIILPQPYLDEIEKIKFYLFEKFGLKGPLRSPAHITLHRPFEWKVDKEMELFKAIESFEKPKGFHLEVSGFNSFEPRVIYADIKPNKELSNYQKELVWHLQKHLKITNEQDNTYGFKPHITLAFRDLKKNKFNEVWEAINKNEINFSFIFNEVSVLKFVGNSWVELKKYITHD